MVLNGLDLLFNIFQHTCACQGRHFWSQATICIVSKQRCQIFRLSSLCQVCLQSSNHTSVASGLAVLPANNCTSFSCAISKAPAPVTPVSSIRKSEIKESALVLMTWISLTSCYIVSDESKQRFHRSQLVTYIQLHTHQVSTWWQDASEAHTG